MKSFFQAGLRGFLFAQEVAMYYYVHSTFLNKTGAFWLPPTRKEEISYEKLKAQSCNYRW